MLNLVAIFKNEAQHNIDVNVQERKRDYKYNGKIFIGM